MRRRETGGRATTAPSPLNAYWISNAYAATHASQHSPSWMRGLLLELPAHRGRAIVHNEHRSAPDDDGKQAGGRPVRAPATNLRQHLVGRRLMLRQHLWTVRPIIHQRYRRVCNSYSATTSRAASSRLPMSTRPCMALALVPLRRVRTVFFRTTRHTRLLGSNTSSVLAEHRSRHHLLSPIVGNGPG